MKILLAYHEGYFLDFVKEVKEFLKGHKVETVDRECLNAKCYERKELIVVIGGDGTFLRTSHLNKKIHMIGINPNPEKKEGFFMQLNRYDYAKKLPAMIKRLDHMDLMRLKVSINDKEIPEKILNEAFIGTQKPYALFNYDIDIEGQVEFQRSSGLLVGTPAGSFAWIKSAGGINMRLSDKKFQYVVREPYEGKLTGNFKLKGGILDENIIIFPKNEGILVVDSVSKEYKINTGDKIVISRTEPLKYVK